MSACETTEIIRGDEEYWREKLAAFLHDPPDKALSLKGHVGRAEAIRSEFYISADEDLVARADQVASGLDRTFLPNMDEGGLIDFPTYPVITHPTGRTRPFNIGPLGNCSAEEVTELIRSDEMVIPQDSQNKAIKSFSLFHYFRHVLPYRLMKEDVCGLGWRWFRLPADTRLPDHSIWQHCSLTSALYSCYKLSSENKASLMVFSITPVQDFIARSRKLRDYWTASLILSWLASEGIKSVISKYGSDHIIYPHPVGQPMIESYLDEICGFSIWKDRYLLVANAATLTNKFLFLMPFGEEEETARIIEGCIINSWKRLAQQIKDRLSEYCFRGVPSLCIESFNKIFDRQIDSFWELNWAAVPLLDVSAIGQLKNFISDHLVSTQEEYFKKAEKCQLPHLSYTEKFFYPISHDLTQRSLAAAKLSPVDCREKEPGIKCHLHPDFEALRFSCLECNEEICLLTNKRPDHNPRPSEDPCWGRIRENWKPHTDFKDTERLSAIGLIKRVAYKVIGKMKEHPLYAYFGESESFPSTTEIAAQDWIMRAKKEIEKSALSFKDVAEILHRSESASKEWNEISEIDEDKIKKVKELIKARKAAKDPLNVVDRYYAILMMDGDRMGHLLSGGFAARWKDVLHPELVERLESGKISEKFYPCFWPGFLNRKRILSPAIHGAISRALAEFSLFSVPYFVSKYGGRLIYAGGDDVCAVFPVSSAVDAALELVGAYNWAFVKWNGKTVEVINDGKDLNHGDLLLSHLGLGREISISAGLLIVHHKWPLRAAIQRAHVLLNLAKDSGRAAMALELQRRAGEKRTFIAGFRDEKFGIPVWKALKEVIQALADGHLSSSFVYRLAALEDGLKSVPESDTSPLVACQMRSSQERQETFPAHISQSIAAVLLGGRLRQGSGVEALQIANFLAEAIRRSKENAMDRN